MTYLERVIPEAAPAATFQEHMNRYIFAEQHVRDKSVLDIACGVGFGSSHLLSGGAQQVFGLDISYEAIVYAQRTYARRGLHFGTAEICNIPFPSHTFDVVVSFETIEHVSDQQRALNEMCRVLRDDGCLIISSPNRLIVSPGRPQRKPWNPYHTIEYTRTEFIKELSNHFRITELYGQIPRKGWYYKPMVRKLLGRFLPGVYDIETVESAVMRAMPMSEYVYYVAICSKKQE